MDEGTIIFLTILGFCLLLFMCGFYSIYLGSNTHIFNCNDSTRENSIIRFYEYNVVTVSCGEDGKLVMEISQELKR